MTYMRLIICGVAKVSMKGKNESNRNFNDHFMNNNYNMKEKHL